MASGVPRWPGVREHRVSTAPAASDWRVNRPRLTRCSRTRGRVTKTARGLACRWENRRVGSVLDFDEEALAAFCRSSGIHRLAAMELELGRLLGNRDVELRTYEDLSRFFRDEVRATAKPLYDAA